MNKKTLSMLSKQELIDIIQSDRMWETKLEYAINGNYKNVDTVYNSRPQNCPIKHISNEDMLKEQKGRIIELPCDVGDKAIRTDERVKTIDKLENKLKIWDHGVNAIPNYVWNCIEEMKN